MYYLIEIVQLHENIQQLILSSTRISTCGHWKASKLRMATGFSRCVGAGGIGFLLADRIAAYRWPEAWTIIFLIVAVVYAIDLSSAWLRGKIIDKNDSAR